MECDGTLRIAGEDFTLSLDLRAAEFNNVASDREILSGGLNPDEYLESLTLTFAADRFDFSVPRSPSSGKPN